MCRKTSDPDSNKKPIRFSSGRRYGKQQLPAPCSTRLAETRMVAFFTEALLGNPAAFGGARSNSPDGQPHGLVGTSYSVAPRLSAAAAKPELELTSNLDKLF